MAQAQVDRGRAELVLVVVGQEQAEAAVRVAEVELPQNRASG